MNAQWQEMSNEYLKVCLPSSEGMMPEASLYVFAFSRLILILCQLLQKQKAEPITGVSSEGYSGLGMVQSKPLKGGIPSDDDD